MKRILAEFFRRGLTACGMGPIVLAVLYLILHRQSGLDTLTVQQVCTGIFSLSALAFVAGGMNVVYQIERLPLSIAIFLHGCVLYISYLGAYLLNNWLQREWMPILFFTVIFLLGYVMIWACIYTVNKKRTSSLNDRLTKHQLRKDPGAQDAAAEKS